MLIILLMVLIPLHTTLAAAAGVRELGEISTAAAYLSSGSEQSTVGESSLGDFAKYKAGCCASCHVFCNFAAPVSASALCSAPTLSQLSVLVPRPIHPYRSHIPDGPLRPPMPPHQLT